MDKTGLVALIIGLAFCALGGYAIWLFLPEVITAIKGLIGIAVVLFGYESPPRGVPDGAPQDGRVYADRSLRTARWFAPSTTTSPIAF